jgi:L-threonylcarbamoyladenylate synthase
LKKINTKIGLDVALAAQWLHASEPVAIPTETVYGLAGNALDVAAVARIFEVKNRPTFDPLIVHVASVAAVKAHVIDFPAAARQLAAHFWPGPLTLLLPKQPHIPDLVTAGLPRVAIRVPVHPLTRTLLERLPFPLAAPSANPFGYISPTTAQHVYDQLNGLIPYILDGGPCQVGLESTIVG